ncbi:endonuclease NucS [Halobacillus sp. A1]|uniref:endonuclease NucS domain-containing protein n=1 Tax=Halobacillus sp. A1 TaxID=2880262 RepID=UPI0020A6BA77|nr:endonuclease NucS domain-containing protein [Halobacillus sp. A1]MCP3033143.1 endonuclease NucS [Halobacillus sp. A1]
MEFNIEVIKESYSFLKVDYRFDEGEKFFVYGYHQDKDEWNIDSGDLLIILDEKKQLKKLVRDFAVKDNHDWFCERCLSKKDIERLTAKNRYYGWFAWKSLPPELITKLQNKILVRLPGFSWRNVKKLCNPSVCFVCFNVCTNCMSDDEYDEEFSDVINLLDLWEHELATEAILEGNEKVLESYIAHKIEIVETGMKLIDTQVTVKDGVIDILAEDKNGTTCIIELKVRTNDKNLIWQSAYYQSEIAEDVRVITIAPSYDEVISKALQNVKNIEMKVFNLDEKGLLQIEDFESIPTLKLSDDRTNLLDNGEHEKAV